MSLFSRFIKNKQVIYSPVKGCAVELESVNDYVFQNKMIGDGAAVIPEEGKLYSPADGEIKVVFPTKHVIGVETEDHIGIIMHVGIDTVELNGEGFHPAVKVGDKVKTGDLLMEFDLEQMQKKFDMSVMICVDNSEQYLFDDRYFGSVTAGKELFSLKEK